MSIGTTPPNNGVPAQPVQPARPVTPTAQTPRQQPGTASTPQSGANAAARIQAAITPPLPRKAETTVTVSPALTARQATPMSAPPPPTAPTAPATPATPTTPEGLTQRLAQWVARVLTALKAGALTPLPGSQPSIGQFLVGQPVLVPDGATAPLPAWVNAPAAQLPRLVPDLLSHWRAEPSPAQPRAPDTPSARPAPQAAGATPQSAPALAAAMRTATAEGLMLTGLLTAIDGDAASPGATMPIPAADDAAALAPMQVVQDGKGMIAALVPVAIETSSRLIRLKLRPNMPPASPGVRFSLDLHMDAVGEMRLQGLWRHSRLDIELLSMAPLPTQWQRRLGGIMTSALRRNGLSGGLHYRPGWTGEDV